MAHDRRRHLAEIVDEYLRRVEFAFERPFTSSWNEMASCMEPLYNVFVGGDEVLVTIDLPYVDHDSVKIRVVAEDTIDVSANTTRPISFKDLGVHHRGGEFNCYHARIHVPVPVDEPGIITKLKRGILEVRMPRVF
jgi:HSP20 family molecular chaperone IbpA